MCIRDRTGSHHEIRVTNSHYSCVSPTCWSPLGIYVCTAHQPCRPAFCKFATRVLGQRISRTFFLRIGFQGPRVLCWSLKNKRCFFIKQMRKIWPFVLLHVYKNVNSTFCARLYEKSMDSTPSGNRTRVSPVAGNRTRVSPVAGGKKFGSWFRCVYNNVL